MGGSSCLAEIGTVGMTESGGTVNIEETSEMAEKVETAVNTGMAGKKYGSGRIGTNHRASRNAAKMAEVVSSHRFWRAMEEASDAFISPVKLFELKFLQTISSPACP